MTDEDQDPITDNGPDDGNILASRDIDITDTPDLSVTAPAVLGADEDSDPQGGVTIDTQITVSGNDVDGSEDALDVSIVLTGVPVGTVFSTGSYDPATGIWTGDDAAANALELTFPADFSGTVTLDITATSPEGSVATAQVITIAPTGDIVLEGDTQIAAETDARCKSPRRTSLPPRSPTPPAPRPRRSNHHRHL